MEAGERESSTFLTLRCASCGGVIGVYEPLVHVIGGVARKTSRAADPQAVRASGDACYHARCCELDLA